MARTPLAQRIEDAETGERVVDEILGDLKHA